MHGRWLDPHPQTRPTTETVSRQSIYSPCSSTATEEASDRSGQGPSHEELAPSQVRLKMPFFS